MEKFKFVNTEEDLEKTTTLERIKDDKEEKKDTSDKIVKEDKKVEKEAKKEKAVDKKKEEKKEEKEEKEETVKTEPEAPIDEDIESFRINKKPYFGFKSRVLFFFVVALLFFIGGCYFLVESVNKSKSDTVSYDEISNISYKVCMNNASHYQEECQQEGRAYMASVVGNIDTTYKYDVKISDEIEYNVKYYVEAKTNIYDKNDSTKLLYSSAENLVDNTPLDGTGDTISILENIKIPYKKYNDFVLSYKSKYAINTDAKLEVNLYFVEDGKSRKVSGLTMDLGSQTFTIKKSNTTNIAKIVDLENNSWDQYNTVCFVVGVILLLCSLFVILKLTSFVSKSINTKSKYQRVLQTILREYDRIIVDTKDGYEVPDDKVVLELDSFTELVDARDTLGKPIIYEKVNDVKSQFFVEDTNKVYKYTLKEVDIEGK